VGHVCAEEALAERVDEPTAGYLEAALDAGQATLALTIKDRDRILRALEDCSDGLAELRGILVREHSWRMREGP
jgi:hypothetical protein